MPANNPVAAGSALSGSVIRSVPTLPAVNAPVDSTETANQKINVTKSGVMGSSPTDFKTIRLSGFESDIVDDVAGYRIVSKYFSLQLAEKDWARVSNEIWEAYRDLGRLVRVDLVANRGEYVVSVSQLHVRKVTVRGTASVNENDLKRIERVVREYVPEGKVADLLQLKKFLLRVDYRARETIATQVVSVDGDGVDITFTVAVREKVESKPWQLAVDDYGLAGFGRDRASARYSAPLFSAGDNLAVQALFSVGQEFGSVRYDFPLPVYLPIRGSIWSSLLHYNVDNALDQTGQAAMAGVDLSYPFFLWGGALITSSLGYEFKGSKDYVQSVTTILTQKWLNNVHLRASGENFWGGRVSFSGDLTMGNLYIAQGPALTQDKAGAKTKGSFTKLYAEAQFLQPITPRTSFSLNLKGQIPNKNLDSLEKFSFGGNVGVRAYGSDVGNADEGVLGSVAYFVALNTHFPARVGAFYDYALGKQSRKPYPGEYGPGEANGFQMDAAGIQFLANYKDFMLNASAAHPVTPSIIKPGQGWRLWAQLTYSF